MLELVQHGRDVVGHGNIDVLFGIIPLNGEAAEQCAVTILGNVVYGAEGL